MGHRRVTNIKIGETRIHFILSFESLNLHLLLMVQKSKSHAHKIISSDILPTQSFNDLLRNRLHSTEYQEPPNSMIRQPGKKKKTKLQCNPDPRLQRTDGQRTGHVLKRSPRALRLTAREQRNALTCRKGKTKPTVKLDTQLSEPPTV